MSLGTNTQASGVSSEATQGTLQGRGSASRGFFVIDGDNDLTDEYIPKDEYNAAVRAAVSVLKNSPRNSPLNAKHVMNKAAKKANHNRPKKHRLSDINRKPVVYPAFEKPSEYTISDAPAAPVAKKSEN